MLTDQKKLFFSPRQLTIELGLEATIEHVLLASGSLFHGVNTKYIRKDLYQDLISLMRTHMPGIADNTGFVIIGSSIGFLSQKSLKIGRIIARLSSSVAA